MWPLARVDSKRLMGPNIVWDHPGALLEVTGAQPVLDRTIAAWEDRVRWLLAGLDWPLAPGVRARRHRGGAMLAVAAPVDALYTATEVNETAWDLAIHAAETDPHASLEALRRSAEEERDPLSLAVFHAARQHGKSAFLDEAGLAVGMGIRGQFWPLHDAPSPDVIDWSALDDIPVALVTGTNGKTTTCRLLAAMLAEAGLSTALTSTEGIFVGGALVDEGDYSGPGGARRALRHRQAEAAVLETARGGLLRRGLAVDRVRAAVITNIAADHLGDGGVNTLEDLTEVKAMVLRALGDEGTAVLNYDDPRLRERGANLARVHWFGFAAPQNATLATTIIDGQLVQRRGAEQASLFDIGSAPLAMAGHARHNISNIMAAAAAATAMGVSADAITRAALSFGARPQDNPGRGHLIDVAGVRYLIDFAHNPHGMAAILDTARAITNGRLAVAFGQAGDRSDEDIRELSLSVARFNPDLVIVKALDAHRRGREMGEVAGLIEATLRERGIVNLVHVRDENGALDAARHWAQDGDLIMMFVPEGRDEVLAALGAKH